MTEHAAGCPSFTVVSPFPGDWRTGWGPPNNVFLHRELTRRRMLRAWMEPPDLPTPPLTSRGYPLWWWRVSLPAAPALKAPVLVLHPALYRAVRRRVRGPVVLKTFGFDVFFRGWRYRIRMPDLRWALRHPPEAWILTDDGSHPPDVLERLGCQPRRGVLVVRNARPAWETRVPLPPFPLRLLVVGRLEKSKGSDLLLRMLPALMTRRDLEVWVAGRGPLESAFHRAARRWPRLRVLQPRPWEAFQRVYGEVHLVMHLVRHANTTLPLVEALHAGRGVVGIPAYPDWLAVGEEEGVRWVSTPEELVRFLLQVEVGEVEALSHAAYHRGRYRFPTWEEETRREVQWLCDVMEEA